MKKMKGKMIEYDRPLAEQSFRARYKLSPYDMKRLLECFMVYGNNAPKHTNGSHYFIQEIIHHNYVDWKSWHKKLHEELKELIMSEYPQLMTVDKEFAAP